MKQPLERNSAINRARFDRWLAEFSSYTATVTRGTIEQWLDQFQANRDVAARVLDALVFYGNQQIRAHYKEGLAALPGWHHDARQRSGRWFFCAFSGSAGESGDSMVHQFRLANGMATGKYSDLFVHRSDLVKLQLTSEDTLVLIDDFSASGEQAVKSWPLFEELLSGEPNVYLLLVAATSGAIDRVTEETDLAICSGVVLDDSANFFSDHCTHFTAQEKQTVERYCRKADRARARGYGACGLLVVFSHRCPNNSLPILHARNSGWDPLFPRHLD